MRRSAGFTLIELTLALALGALVVLLAHRVYGAVVEAAFGMERASEALDREANARRLLATLIGSLEVNPETGPFAGEAHSVSFTTWHAGSGGWLEHRRVTIAVAEGRLVVGGLADQPLALTDRVRAFELDYLLGFGADQRWVRNWSSALTAPTALRLRLARRSAVDTLVLLVGSRG